MTNTTTKIWFNIGPYEDNFVGFAYSTRKAALSNATVGEQTVGVNINQLQKRTLISALKDAYASLG